MSAAAPVRYVPDGRRLFLEAMASATRPRKRVTVSQWADGHRILSSKASSEPGDWRTARTPFLREPMDCLSVTSTVKKVVLKFAAQMGKTEIALNWIGYVMDHAPAPMLITVPTLEVRKRWVRQRLEPMLTDTKVLAKIFNALSKRDGANAEDMKDFPGGFLVIGGANSPASLASMPIKYVINDEVDRFPWEVGKGDKSEGDPLGLIRARQANFNRRKELLASTPTMKGASRIDEEYEASDQRTHHVPCPHCHQLLVFQWKNLHWTMSAQTRELTRIVYVCEHCGCEIDEHHKTQMLERGRWVPKYPERSHEVRGYYMPSLYSPLGLGWRWAELVRMWLDAQSDKAKLKRFINTCLAESYEDRSRDVKPERLKERAEPYGLREIPPGCLALTCGIDTQNNRLAIQVVGWGREETCWIIDWLELPGDPVRMLDEARRGEGALIEYLKRPFTNKFGKQLFIQAVAIDTGGHHTHDVYNFVRSNAVRRLMAVKGSNTPSKPILSPRPQAQDVNWKGKVIKGGVKLWMVGTDTAKHALVARLLGDNQLLESAEEGAPPATLKIRFAHELPDDYYAQLTSEVFDPERNKWVKRRGRRNEALDTWVYAAAAAQHPEIRVHAMRANDWKRLEQLLEPESEEQKAAPAETAPPAEQPKNEPPRNPPRPRRAGFVNRWRS